MESDNFRRRTAMFIGEKKLNRLKAFMDGYFYAMGANGIQVEETSPPFEQFPDWIAAHFGWRESTAGWKHIILKECAGKEEQAVDTFFKLYDQFKGIKN